MFLEGKLRALLRYIVQSDFNFQKSQVLLYTWHLTNNIIVEYFELQRLGIFVEKVL